MRALYLVFSHDHQKQLYRLVSAMRLLSPKGLIVIHHDPSNGPLDASVYINMKDVYLIPTPVCGDWGGFSLVEQYLHSFKWCKENLNFDWIITLTGLTYPIMPLTNFENHLESSDYDAFIYNFNAFDVEHWPKGTATKRYLFYYIKLPRNHYYYKLPTIIKSALNKTRIKLNKIQPFLRIAPMPRGVPTRLGIRRWRFPFNKDFTIYGGRQMVTINNSALNEIFSFIKNNKGFINYSKHTLIPDESFFVSIICNSKKLKICNNLLRYIKWPKGISHPSSGDVILKDDIDDAIDSGEPFALKFDSRIDATTLDLLDTHLGISSDQHS